MLNAKQIRFLQTLFPCQTEDAGVIPPNAAGFSCRDEPMKQFAQELIDAGLIQERGVDSCGTAWYWPTAFEETYNAVFPLCRDNVS